MSLAGMGQTGSPVVEAGVRFLVDSMRDDGSWPIDTNLATWVTTLSIGALADAGALPPDDAPAMRRWLLGQQSTREHPFTHAAPGAWAWTPLSGGVPDADDTSGALLALAAAWRAGSARRSPRRRPACAGCWACRTATAASRRSAAGGARCRSTAARRRSPRTRCRRGAPGTRTSTRRCSASVRAARGASRRVPRRDASGRTAAGSRSGSATSTRRTRTIRSTARLASLLGLHSTLGARRRPRRGLSSARASTWLLDAQNADGGWGGGRGVAVVDRGNRRRAGGARPFACGWRRAADSRRAVERGAAG